MVAVSARPGKTAVHQTPLLMSWTPWAIISPHSGVGIRTPTGVTREERT
jgi:hypothetical protein